MKIAKVSHTRCDQWAATTYVWVQDDMTAEEFDKLCQLAKEAYLEAEQAAKTAAPPNPGYHPSYEKFPNMTVAEVKAEHEKQQALYSAWDEKRKAARKTFSDHMVDVSGGRVQSFYNVECFLSNDVSWGHRHGQTIEYGETKVWAEDLNAVEDDGI